jgi:hypothetical protein
MFHMYRAIGILMALAALASAMSSLVAKERSTQKLGVAFCGLFILGAVAALSLAKGWS